MAHHFHSMFRKGFRALVAGVLVSLTASSAFAEDDVSGPPVAPTSSLMACVTACGKLAKDNKTSPELLVRCPMSGIPECAGLKFSEQVALENACLNCGNFSAEVMAAVALALKDAEAKEAARLDAEAKAKAAAKASRPAPRPRTAQQVCEQDKKSKWISAPVLDKDGNPTGQTKLRCFTLADAHDLLEKLKGEGRLPSAAPSSEAASEASSTSPMAPAATALTPEEREQLKATEIICKPIPGRKATLFERCNELETRLAFVEREARVANDTAKTGVENAWLAQKEAQRGHSRLNDIVTGRTTIPSRGEQRPHLWFSLAGKFQMTQSLHDRVQYAVGPEAMWSPPGITRFVRLHFHLGFGGGPGARSKALPVLWGGGGFARMLDNEDLVGELLASFEKRFSSDPQQESVCYGGGGAIHWMPGAASRRADAWVPLFGSRVQLGPCIGTDRAGKTVSYFNPIGSVYVGAGF